MGEKKSQIKLFTWKYGIIMSVVTLAGIGLGMYTIYERKGSLDRGDFLTAIFSLLFAAAIFTSIAYYGNRPEKRE